LPGNRFEALKGDRRRQYSIRINDLLIDDLSTISGGFVLRGRKVRHVP